MAASKLHPIRMLKTPLPSQMKPKNSDPYFPPENLSVLLCVVLFYCHSYNYLIHMATDELHPIFIVTRCQIYLERKQDVLQAKSDNCTSRHTPPPKKCRNDKNSTVYFPCTIRLLQKSDWVLCIFKRTSNGAQFFFVMT